MIYDKMFEEFLEEIKLEGTYASMDEIREVSKVMLEIIKKKKDATPEELVEEIITENINQLKEIKRNYPIPGYTVGMSVGDINVKIVGGNRNHTGESMPEDALFDIASMTKFYTQIIAYNLMKEKVFNYYDKIIDLDSRFQNVGNLTVGQVLRFGVEFRTMGRISEKTTIEKALECLYEMKVVSTENYNYNDMGMMLMKEVMEKVTGKTYDELVEKYITNPLNLKDTYLVVPKKEISRLTGSANASIGYVNDPSALAVGGYSGHAGVVASSDDLIKLGKGVEDEAILSKEALKAAYIPGIKDNRGIMGNTYTSHKQGIDMSYVDILEPITNFAIQGSTRCQMNIGRNSVSTICLNPASMGLERAIIEQERVNVNRIKNNQAPLQLVKSFEFYHEGKKVTYDLVDARLMAPSAKTVEPITTQNAKLTLRLRFLDKVMKEYDTNAKVKVMKKVLS